jgi:hypothetical protein
MTYVYEQKSLPTNVTGVFVTLSVIDANNNYRVIGTTTSAPNGFFSYNWKPDIPGTYTLYASFSGSDSYYGSNGVTAFQVDNAHASTATPIAETTSMADAYFIPAIAGLFVLIIIVLALVVLQMLRKRP